MSFYGPEPLWNGLLRVDDFQSDDPVVVQFEDGSECKFYNAFYRRENNRIVVYTEHCGYHSFHQSATVITGLDRTQDKK